MIPRFSPHLDIADISEALFHRAGRVEEFEKSIAQQFGARVGVAFPYGRTAQWAFFKCMGIEGAEIVMPAYTCSVVAHAVSLSGNHPIFVDIDLSDYNMDLDQFERAITERTRSVIATHTFGYPENCDRIREIVETKSQKFGHKIWLMQDCCHCFGAKWKGDYVGNQGDVAVYAFNVSKHLTSIFGGMLTFPDEGTAAKVRKWRDENLAPATWTKALKRMLYLGAVTLAFDPRIYKATWFLSERTKFLNRFTKTFHLDSQIHFPGDYRIQMTDTEAAVGLKKLPQYDSIIRTRKENAEAWFDALSGQRDWQRAPLVEGATYSHYVVRVPDRDAVINDFAAKNIHLGNLIQYSIPDLPCYADLNQSCPNSKLASQSLINLPVTEPSERIRRWIAKYLKS